MVNAVKVTIEQPGQETRMSEAYAHIGINLVLPSEAPVSALHFFSSENVTGGNLLSAMSCLVSAFIENHGEETPLPEVISAIADAFKEGIEDGAGRLKDRMEGK
ncbi:hypothetical protein [Paenibacillus xylanexedens]|uniref:hypothetical protein n=1 Tax=Paenibacillus xylanexedens TaxID=528191 RepID=UPI0011A6F01B|nr:hypothetical protein [Paenibacillus xylanexedens]